MQGWRTWIWSESATYNIYGRWLPAQTPDDVLV
jgi:hypothetical protein